MATTSTQPNLQFLYGSDLATKKPPFKQGTIYLDIKNDELWYDTPNANTGNHIKLFHNTYLSLSGGTLTGNLLPSVNDNYDLGSSSYQWSNLYVSKINDKSIGAAISKGVKDNISAAALSSSGTNLVTERTVYYGLPTINNAHNYNSSTTIYAPTTGGTAGYILKANGVNSTPTWVSADSVIGTNYVLKTGDTMTGALIVQDKVTANEYGLSDKATVQYDTAKSALRFVIS